MSWPVSDRRDQHNRVLIWIEAKDHVSGVANPMGIWDGRDHMEFEVEGQIRPFYGAGNVQELAAFTTEAGVVVHNHSIDLAAFSPEVRELVRGRDIRFARVQIYVLSYDPETGAQISLSRVFHGVVDAAPEEIGPAGSDAKVTLNLVSNARLLTRKTSVLKSHAAQSKRQGDAFFRYADGSGNYPVFWGREKHSL